MSLEPSELASLAGKYERLAELRARGATDETPEDRRALRELAQEFPGALRELDSLPTEELERRRAALAQASRAGHAAAIEPWMEWMHAYHAVMRIALKMRRGRTVQPAELEALGLDDAFARTVAAPPHGRIMAAVFDHLALRFGVSAKRIWDALFPPRKGERSYRAR